MKWATPASRGRFEARSGQDIRGDGDRTGPGQPGADDAWPVGQRGPFEHRGRWYRISRTRPRGPARRARCARRSVHPARVPRAILRDDRSAPGTVRPASGSRCRARREPIPFGRVRTYRRGGESMVATRLRLLSLLTAARASSSVRCSRPRPRRAGPPPPAARVRPPPAQGPGRTAVTDLQIPDVVEGKFNVAMVLIGPHDDGGWSQAHYEGLQYVCENVPDTPRRLHRARARGRRLRAGVPQPRAQGLRLHHRHLVRLHGPDGHRGRGVPRHHVPAPHRATSPTARTSATSSAPIEDMKYLAGMLAGSRAKLDGNPKLGYMATFPIPEELRLGNAIMLGVKQTCPECTMDMRFINTWHDPVNWSATAPPRCSTQARRSCSPVRTRRPTPTWRRRRASGPSPTTTRTRARSSAA